MSHLLESCAFNDLMLAATGQDQKLSIDQACQALELILNSKNKALQFSFADATIKRHRTCKIDLESGWFASRYSVKII